MSWLNSDDLLLPHSLEYVVLDLDSGSEADIAYGDILIVDDHSIVQRTVSGKPFCLADMILDWSNPVHQQGFLMRRSLLDRVGYLDEHFHFTMDFEYWVRIALEGGSGIAVPRVLGAFRHHQAAKSSRIQLQRIEDRFAIYDKVFSQQLPSQIGARAKDSKAALHLNAVKIAYPSGDLGIMRRHAFQHILLSGHNSSLWAFSVLAMSATGNRGFRILRSLGRSLRLLFCAKDDRTKMSGVALSELY